MNFLSNFFSKEESITLKVSSSNGFHLRPIAKFVRASKEFECQIFAKHKNRMVNAQNVNTLLSLTLEFNHTFELIAKGKNAQQAIETLKDTFNQLMHQDTIFKPISKQENPYLSTHTLLGESIYQGIALAPIYHYQEELISTKSPLSFEEAIQKVAQELSQDEKNEIYLAQKELLLSLFQDISTMERFEKRIQQKREELKNTKFETKMSDYQDLLRRVQYYLGSNVQIITPNEPFILSANDILPSQIETLSLNKNLKGVILKETSLTSHTAILLRSYGITSIIAPYLTMQEGTVVILDSIASMIVSNPHHQDQEIALKRIELDNHTKKSAYQNRFEPTQTRNNKKIEVVANISDIPSAKQAKENGARAIGLLRTEFLFKEHQPSLDEQVDTYRTIFELFDEVTVRTLDVGGDKKLPYMPLIQENNPFLGIRGIRLLQVYPDIIERQLQAIFMASENKNIKIMFPMISSVVEFNEAKAFALKIIKKHHLNVQNISFGMMVEVPSVLFLIKEFNEVVDFYSIGTNDLTQYLFAIERTHPSLKVDELSPVIFNSIELLIKEATKPMSICGELASNTKAIPKLIGLGINRLSVSVQSIAQTKEEIRKV